MAAREASRTLAVYLPTLERSRFAAEAATSAARRSARRIPNDQKRRNENARWRRIKNRDANARGTERNAVQTGEKMLAPTEHAVTDVMLGLVAVFVKRIVYIRRGGTDRERRAEGGVRNRKRRQGNKAGEKRVKKQCIGRDHANRVPHEKSILPIAEHPSPSFQGKSSRFKQGWQDWRRYAGSIAIASTSTSAPARASAGTPTAVLAGGAAMFRWRLRTSRKINTCFSISTM